MNTEVLALLLEAYADPSAATTTAGTTPVHMAAPNGHAEVLALLLQATADPSAATTDNGATPVFIAALKGHLDILIALVAAGASTGTALTSNGATDLWAAAWQGHTEMVRYLVSTDGVEIVEINRARSDQLVRTLHLASQAQGKRHARLQKWKDTPNVLLPYAQKEHVEDIKPSSPRLQKMKVQIPVTFCCCNLHS